MRTKIAILTDGIAPFETGGMQTYCKELVNGLSLLDCHILLFHTTLSGDKQKAKDYILTEPNKAYYVNYPAKPQFPGHYYWEQKQLSKKYYEKILSLDPKPDVVYAHGFTACHENFGKLFKKYKIPVIVNLHGMNMFQDVLSSKGKLGRLLMKKLAMDTFRNAQGIISLGSALTKLIPIKFRNRTIHEIPCGVSSEFMEQLEHKFSDKISFLFVGRKDPVKGMEVLKQAIQSLETEGININLTIVGDWTKEEFTAYNSSIHVLGKLTNAKEIQKIYLSHQIVLVPSLSEGFPLVILEALASGCYVVATKVGCVEELAQMPAISILEPGNHHQLAQKMKELMNWTNKDFKNGSLLARNAVLEKYNWQKISLETYGFLNSFVNQNI